MNIDLNTMVIALIAIVATGALGYLVSNFKNSDTRNQISTLDGLLDLLYIIADNITDLVIVDIVYNVLDGLIGFAMEMVDSDTLDKQLLIATALGEVAQLGYELTEQEEKILRSGIDIIYMFVRK